MEYIVLYADRCVCEINIYEDRSNIGTVYYQSILINIPISDSVQLAIIFI